VFLAQLVYVNDLVLTGNSPSHCATFKTYLRALQIEGLGISQVFIRN